MKLESDLDGQPWSQNLREITYQNFHDPKEGNGAGIVDESGNINGRLSPPSQDWY